MQAKALVYLISIAALLPVMACEQRPTPTAEPAATITPSPTQVFIPTPPVFGEGRGVLDATGLGFTIAFIDVAQGDATLIIANTGETLLIDGGRSRERIQDRLGAMGITDLDAIAMTHPDVDHIGGLVKVIELYPIERIYLNGADSESLIFKTFIADVNSEGAEVITVTRGDSIPLGGLTLQVVHPGTLRDDSNEDSMVLLLDCGDVKVLLTGDAETPSENEMLDAGVLVDIDVLKVGHHGSNTSTSQAFLDVVQPEVAVISAGLDNQYGYPHDEVVDRLVAAGVKIYMTDTTKSGVETVTMTSDCKTYELG